MIDYLPSIGSCEITMTGKELGLMDYLGISRVSTSIADLAAIIILGISTAFYASYVLAEPPPAIDLCQQNGVVRCTLFDSNSDIESNMQPAGDGQVRGLIDTAVSASGAGSLRFEIPGNSSANSSGAWNADLGHNFGPGETLHVMFRQRFSPEMLTGNHSGDGWKQVIFHGQAASCSNVELTTQNIFHRGFPQMYTACGSGNFRVDLGNGDFLLQQGDYECHYQNQNSSDCSFYRANEWMTFYYEFDLGAWGTPTSNIRAYVAYEGGPLKQFVDIRNYTLRYRDGPSDTYNRVKITPYNTGKNTGQSHATAFTWYDDLVVSTQPILVTPIDPDASIRPMPPTGLAAQ